MYTLVKNARFARHVYIYTIVYHIPIYIPERVWRIACDSLSSSVFTTWVIFTDIRFIWCVIYVYIYLPPPPTLPFFPPSPPSAAVLCFFYYYSWSDSAHFARNFGPNGISRATTIIKIKKKVILLYENICFFFFFLLFLHTCLWRD